MVQTIILHGLLAYQLLVYVYLLFYLWFSKTSKFASIITTVLSFVSFLIFINASYMYLSEVFYGGFNMKAIQEMDKEYIISLFMFLISGIVGNISIYQKQNKLQEDNKHE